MREIIFDTETTGLDPRTGHRLVEIGCIELIDRRESGRTFHAYFHPERDMPAEAEAVHGLSIQFLSDKPLFAARVDELLDFLGDAPMVAHNAAFDFGFVNAELARVGRPPLDMARMCCTVQMARKLHPGAKHSLDALCTRYGIDRSHRVKHGALLDAELLHQSDPSPPPARFANRARTVQPRPNWRVMQNSSPRSINPCGTIVPDRGSPAIPWT